VGADMFFDSESWSVTGGLFDMVLEEVAAIVTSPSLSDQLHCIVQNQIGILGIEQLRASDQLEFLHAIMGDMRQNVLAHIPADNPILDLTTARLDDLVKKAANQLRLHEQ
jgi:hypothetical protein